MGLADEARDQVRVELSAGAAADEAKVMAAIAGLSTLLGDAATPGSIRAWRTQDASALVSAAGLRGLADVLLVLAQALRVLSRQVLRLTRLSAGLTASDVGATDA